MGVFSRTVRWRALLILPVAALLLTLSVRAQPDDPDANGPLGETPAQIARRYGPVRRHYARVRHHQVLEGGSALDGDLYEKNGIIIRVAYTRGHAEVLEFNRESGPLTPADVRLLLASAAGGCTWQPGATGGGTIKMYSRSDKHALAHWTPGDDGSLLIASEDADKFDDKLLP